MRLFKLWLLYHWNSWMIAAPVYYRLSWESPPRYTYIVEIEASPSRGGYTDFALPAWRPGRYIIQNYAGAVSHFEAFDAEGGALPWRKVSKDVWRVQNPSRGPIRVRYRFFAKQIDAGSSYLSEGLVYFNPINLFMYLPGRLDEPCELEIISLPEGWAVASALPRVGPRRFKAHSYHHLADSPFLSGSQLRSEQITCGEATLYAHFWGQVGAQRLSGFMEKLCKIVQVQTQIWGRLPLREYHFIYLLVPFQMRHAVEHEYSAMFVLPEEGAASEEALNSFLGISAHEFFHVWNVKRLRPAALVPYRYDREVYTSLHWLTEGITDYYTGVTLARAGFISPQEYWQRLSADLSQVENAYAYKLFSPAELSIDSWLATSPYRPSAYQGSFYAAGKRVGFLLDMVLRVQTGGRVTLDSLMRYLYEQYYEKGKGLPEDGVEKAAIRLGGPALRSFFDKYIWGKERPDYERLLQGLPLQVKKEERLYEGLGRLGIIRTQPNREGGLQVEEILPESIADRMGLEVGDVLLKLGGRAVEDVSPQLWEDFQEGEKVAVEWKRGGFLMKGDFTYRTSELCRRAVIEIVSEGGFIP
ncbi:MAG: PDZ domain-containing protein [Bacteroidia bacterium]|nr:PDZ domain-containing protein [Bacteroidia bacterium]MCX7764449.1 PDZ domain-containing protein [Bacteroidia bacterium]MDW8058265.1 PDZ domain-containing protein [Bacteroidia bacterium]